MLQRYAHGLKTDEPEAWYEGSAMTTREWIHTVTRYGSTNLWSKRASRSGQFGG